MVDRAILWKGRSQLTGTPITLTVTGLDGSSDNPKTGPMAQTWILAGGVNPMAAVANGRDTAICGNCPLRGGPNGRQCYVQVKNAPRAVFKKNRRLRGQIVPASQVVPALRGRSLRMGSYGDPCAVPLRVWQKFLAAARTWTGYTHQWRTAAPSWRRYVMASVDSRAERDQAWSLGWRTFRVLEHSDTVDAGEVLCPASKEAGQRTTCDRCGLCSGTSNPCKSVAIYKH